jgi:hypothetical protein
MNKLEANLQEIDRLINSIGEERMTEDFEDELDLDKNYLEDEPSEEDFEIDEEIPEEDFEIDSEELDENEEDFEGDWVDNVVDNYEPSEEAEEVYQQIVDEDKLEDLKDLLRNQALFPLEMDNEQLDQLFKFESEFVLSELELEEA